MVDKNCGVPQQHGLCGNMLTEESVKLGGKIWISTTNGTCSYQCIFCDCQFFSAKSFEQHIPNVHNDQQRWPVPQPLPPPTVPSTQLHLAHVKMRRPSRFEPEKKHVQPNSSSRNNNNNQSAAGYGQSSGYYQGAADHRRMNIDANKRRVSNDMNRRQVNIDANRHREKVHGKSNGPTTSSNAQHRRHDPVKDETKKFPCTRCEAKYNTFESLRDHIRRRHFHRCMHCVDDAGKTSKAFETEKGLWSHQRAHHTKHYPYKCDVCPRAFDSRQKLTDHMGTVHVRGKDVKCDFCTRVLMSTFQKKNHIKRAHANRRYHCQLCK